MTTKNRLEANRAAEHLRAAYRDIKHHPMRQRYHFQPPAGWCNDPNGLCQYNGKYHLFYQHMPYNSTPHDYSMYWGHAESTDLCHWRHMPPALCPVDAYDSGGCWSGSAFADEDGLSVMYTAIDRRNHDQQCQCLAHSKDLVTFEKDPQNPLLTTTLETEADKADFRDPKVWRHGDHWYMVVGSTTHDHMGRVLLYRSQDRHNWEFVNYLVESNGELGPVSECPDFFQLDGRWVLLLSLKNLNNRKALYLVGDFDYKVGRLHWDVLGEVDWGMDFYAPQTFLDEKGRRILIAWQESWDWMPWSDGKYYTAPLGWCGGMTLPRVLSLDSRSRLVVKPAPELASLRGAEISLEPQLIPEGTPLALTVGDNIHCEWMARFDLAKTHAAVIEIDMRGGKDCGVTARFDLEKGLLVFDRTHTLHHIPYVRQCPLRSASAGSLEIHIFMDTTSIEIFYDNYLTGMSNTIYLPTDATGMQLRAVGGDAALAHFKGWAIQEALPEMEEAL